MRGLKIKAAKEQNQEDRETKLRKKAVLKYNKDLIDQIVSEKEKVIILKIFTACRPFITISYVDT